MKTTKWLTDDNLKYYIFAIGALSVIFYLPKFFEIEVVSIQVPYLNKVCITLSNMQSQSMIWFQIPFDKSDMWKLNLQERYEKDESLLFLLHINPWLNYIFLTM